MAGVTVHRVPADEMPRDLDAFVAWVEGLNSHMLAAAASSASGCASTSSTATTGSSPRAAAAGSPTRLRCPYVTTIHATEYGRHHGWVEQHPQSYIHGIETWMARRADA